MTRLRAVPRSAWLLLGLALVARVGHILLTSGYVPVSDSLDFQRHAVSIADGHGFPTSIVVAGGPSAFRAPLYPYVLGGLYAVVGAHLTAARLLGAVIGTLGVGALGLLGAQLLGRRQGLVAMAIAAVYPPLLIASDSLLSEGLFVLCELAALAAAFRFRADPRLRWAATAGAFAGLAALDRSNGLLLLAPLVLVVWVAPRRRRTALAAPVVLLAVALATLVPWTVRNVDAFHRGFAVTTQTGYGLAGTFNETVRTAPRYPGTWRPPDTLPDFRALYARGLDEAAMDRALRRRGVAYARAHPGYVLQTAGRNTLRLFDLGGWRYTRTLGEILGIDRRSTALQMVSFWLVGLLALGALATRAARGLPAAFWLAAVLLIASAVFISGTSRYRAPVEPFFVLLAAQALVALRERAA